MDTAAFYGLLNDKEQKYFGEKLDQLIRVNPSLPLSFSASLTQEMTISEFNINVSERMTND